MEAPALFAGAPQRNHRCRPWYSVVAYGAFAAPSQEQMILMKIYGYALVAVAALGLVAGSRQGTVAPAVAAEAAPASTSSVKGDLVIDFLGAQRGYVEPCG